MKLYEVSVKYGDSRYHLKAYVDGKNKDDAIIRYCGDAERYERNLLGGIKFRAKLTTLPDDFWDMPEDIRPRYIPADTGKPDKEVVNDL